MRGLNEGTWENHAKFTLERKKIINPPVIINNIENGVHHTEKLIRYMYFTKKKIVPI